jgi:hypothetical protein
MAWLARRLLFRGLAKTASPLDVEREHSGTLSVPCSAA